MQLRLAGTIKESTVDGPGIRFTIFTQGCPHHCSGCHNPETHDLNGGTPTEVLEIVNQFTSNPFVRDVTISGGEPLLQINPLLEFLDLASPHLSNVILYSGYTFEKIFEMAQNNKALFEILSKIDYLIDGPFIQEKRDISLKYRGSKNQRIIDVKKSLSSHEVIIKEFPLY